jgi:uncharacterized protein YceK
MKKLICLALILAVTGCATCKSSDSAEQCRTKQRDKSQKNSSLVHFCAHSHAAKVGSEFN